MPIFKFIHPITKIIIEQYRTSRFDDTPFIKNNVRYSLLTILDDYPLLSAEIQMIRYLFFNEGNRHEVMEDILRSMSSKEKIDILARMAGPSEWTLGKINAASQQPYSNEELKRFSKIKNPVRASKKRSSTFGILNLNIKKSSIGLRGPTRITPIHMCPDIVSDTNPNDCISNQSKSPFTILNQPTK